MPANTSSTIPRVPVITLVKKSIAIMAAIINLIILSADPMFFFIVFIFNSTKIESVIPNLLL